MSQQTTAALDALHHVAIAVEDIKAAVDWYTKTFHCKVSYQDDTWAMLELANVQLALVIPSQHPPHIAFVSSHAEQYGTLKTHRDGTRSTYITDPAGNAIEVLAQD
jgi:catechol 2,3-dioxygenase-like lactoylglutathione lyase family enzyme